MTARSTSNQTLVRKLLAIVLGCPWCRVELRKGKFWQSKWCFDVETCAEHRDLESIR